MERGMLDAILYSMTVTEAEVLWSGGISVRSRTDLVVINGSLTGQRYIDEVLRPVDLPFLHQHQYQTTSCQNSARIFLPTRRRAH